MQGWIRYILAVVFYSPCVGVCYIGTINRSRVIRITAAVQMEAADNGRPGVSE